MDLSKLHIHHLDRVDSTNSRLKELINSGKIPDRYVLYADYQEQGRGTGGNKWESEAGKNLLCSIYTRNPGGINELVFLSSGTALVIVSTLREFGIESHIKWPNDVMVGNRKIAGILIENALYGDKIQYSIAGIGLNVNQEVFQEPSAISMKLISGETYKVQEVLQKLLANYMELRTQPEPAALAMVNKRLYKKDEDVIFIKGDEEHVYRILAMNGNGTLKVKDDTGEKNLEYGKWKWKKDFV